MGIQLIYMVDIPLRDIPPQETSTPEYSTRFKSGNFYLAFDVCYYLNFKVEFIMENATKQIFLSV